MLLLDALSPGLPRSMLIHPNCRLTPSCMFALCVLSSTDVPPTVLLDPFDPYKITEKTRKLDLMVCRGNAVMLICPMDGTMEIANPFSQAQQVEMN